MLSKNDMEWKEEKNMLKILENPILFDVLENLQESINELDEKTNKIFQINGLIIGLFIGTFIFGQFLEIDALCFLLSAVLLSFVSILIALYLMRCHWWSCHINVEDTCEMESIPDEVICDVFLPIERVKRRRRISLTISTSIMVISIILTIIGILFIIF
ncbi:MAG: hypothetical protein ACTSQI_20595 [Candidatus Helarchaeota archaeon]